MPVADNIINRWVRGLGVLLFAAGLICWARPGHADELPSGFSLGQMDWKDTAAIDSVFGTQEHRDTNGLPIVGETFRSTQFLRPSGNYGLLFSNVNKPSEGFLRGFVSRANSVWGPPAVENDMSASPRNRFASDYYAEWTVGNTRITFKFHKFDNEYVKDYSCALTFGNINDRDTEDDPSSVNDYDKMMQQITAYLVQHPEEPGAYAFRARLYLDQAEFEKAWQDVHKIQSLGGTVDPDFLHELSTISRRSS